MQTRAVENPIPFNPFFYTPNSFADLQERIEQLPAYEKKLVYNFVTWALNVSHKAVEDEVFSKEVFI